MSAHEVCNDLLTSSSGVDFDDPEYGFKEEDKDPLKVNSPCFPSEYDSNQFPGGK